MKYMYIILKVIRNYLGTYMHERRSMKNILLIKIFEYFLEKENLFDSKYKNIWLYLIYILKKT